MDLYWLVATNYSPVICITLQFIMGLLGALTYFMFHKHFISEDGLKSPNDFFYKHPENPENNSNSLLNNKEGLFFFCIIGGVLPIILGVTTLYGSFLQGILFRSTILSILNHIQLSQIGGI